MKTLLVVDDHPIVLEGIRSLLTQRGYGVLKAQSASQALSVAETIQGIDAYIIDLSLQRGNDGLELVSRLRREGFTAPVLVYTMHEELWNIAELVRADVQGIVLKGDGLEELCKAVDQVVEGRTYRSRAIEERRHEAMQVKGILSAKDIEVLRLISEGASSREVAEAIHITEKTVEYHRSNILRKMCARTMAEATRRAVSLGII